ncbi:MAG: hypothetical protein B7C54_06170 [Acidimicrobiales bacterium mtb01]|nr:hypothetical protein [Actinomycetota bacterium]TEX46774.1 MAG: hypothetical protein B7C54_06170 [Acidimicrobiales bacterium mtb01]
MRDRGIVSGFVVCLTLTLTAATGLAIDAGRLVAAHVQVADHAENAARVGAQEITLIRAGIRALDPVKARSAARDYLAAHGLEGDVVVSGRSITVTVRREQPTVLLDLLGIGSQRTSASRTAVVVAG